VQHERLLIINLSLVSDQPRNETFTPTPIGNRMKVLSAGVTLDRPLQPTALAPVFLFHPKNGQDLILKMISTGPPVFIQTNLVRQLIQGINLR
jgi:hypothetical protein